MLPAADLIADLVGVACPRPEQQRGNGDEQADGGGAQTAAPRIRVRHGGGLS